MPDPYYTRAKQWIDFAHQRSRPLQNAEFHLHNRFEIYFFIAGAVNYFIEKQVHHLNYGDLLLLNSHEIHKPTFLSGQSYERIVVHFQPELADRLSAPEFNLLDCFRKRPQGERNKIRLNPMVLAELLQLFSRMENCVVNPFPGSDTLKLGVFLEILVLINNAFLKQRPTAEPANIPETLVPILAYIETHLNETLTLKSLSQRFFINRSYLSRLFKKSIGSNIHEFIIYKRLSQAKKLLNQGHNVTDACALCGYNDYANFLRMFKRKVGVSPGKYKLGTGEQKA
jgi:AraC-like DNA-binding protein